MEKKSLLLRLVVLLAAMMCARGASAHDFEYGGYYYTILTDSTVAINHPTGQYGVYSGNVTIPEGVYDLSTHTHYTVTQIYFRAFEECTGLISVTIPNTVTSIEPRAFKGCTSLRTVVMGKNCSFFDPGTNGYATQVFENCPNLTSITCWMFNPDQSVEQDGYYNFDQSVHDNATLYVPRGAIPNYQATEGWRLFAHIQEAPGDYNYDFYQDGVFYKIRGSGQVKVTYKDEDYNSYSGTVTVPGSVLYKNTGYDVKGIDDYAFRECVNLTGVNVPEGLDSIGTYAFMNCYVLPKIDIPHGVTYIGNGAFQGCRTFKSIIFPAGVTKIYGSTCNGCYSLETVVFPVDLTNIYAGSFSYCNAIKTIISLNEIAPSLYNSYIFSSTVYENATLYIPEDAYANTYTSTNGYWYNFATQKPYDQYLSDAINAAGTNITFSSPSIGNYPWLVKTNAGRTCAQSGNTGIHNSSSTMTATVTGPGSLSFDFKAWGQGSSSALDYCLFMVDGVTKFRYGARENDWEAYTVELDEGTHTLTWRYTKNNNINRTGDYFAISNVRFTSYASQAYACYTPSNTTLTFYYDNQRSNRSGTTYDLNTDNNDVGWDTDGTKSYVTKVVFDPSFAGARPKTTTGWFFGMRSLQSITGMSYLNTSEVTNMNWMFKDCSRLTSLDLSHFNTSNVISMTQMFEYCLGLTSLDLSSFNTSQVIRMNLMFNDCKSLQTIYVGDGWSTAAVTSSSYMFSNCTSLVGGQGTTYDANHIDKAYAHIDGGTSNPGYFTRDPNVLEAYACYTPSNTTLTFYYDKLRSSRTGTTYDLNTGSNSDTGWELDGTNRSVTRVVFDPSFADARPTTTASWFYYMDNLQIISGLNYLNTSEVTDMDHMFANCLMLPSIDVGHFNTSKVTSMATMFSSCHYLASLDLSSFNTSKVTDMHFMFRNCNSLRTIYVGSEWSTAAVTSSERMFTGCHSLVGGQGTTYDANHVDKAYAHIDGGTSNPGYFTDASVPRAYACYTPSNTTLTFYYDNLRNSRTGTTYDLNESYTDVGWQTDGTRSNVTNVVFDPSFAGARPTTTHGWFYSMQLLVSITGLEYLNTSEVDYMRHMFYYCRKLTSLDLSGFNTSKVTNMNSMFKGCTNLQTIYVGNDWSTAAVEESDDMFTNCYNLVGGKGTTYDANHVDKAYAHIDGGTSNPGYFTAKNAGLRGDVNGDGSVSIGDVTALIDYLLSGDASGIDQAAADCNQDNGVSIGDVTALIDYLLAGSW